MSFIYRLSNKHGQTNDYCDDCQDIRNGDKYKERERVSNDRVIRQTTTHCFTSTPDVNLHLHV